jgi:hypothetical protein
MAEDSQDLAGLSEPERVVEEGAAGLASIGLGRRFLQKEEEQDTPQACPDNQRERERELSRQGNPCLMGTL